MKNQEKILKQIIEGNSSLLLREEASQEILDEFLHYDLIDIKDDKIMLTKKGMNAASTGIQNEIHRLKMEEEMKPFSPEVVRRESTLFLLCLVTCILLVLFFLLFDISDYL